MKKFDIEIQTAYKSIAEGNNSSDEAISAYRTSESLNQSTYENEDNVSVVQMSALIYCFEKMPLAVPYITTQDLEFKKIAYALAQKTPLDYWVFAPASFAKKPGIKLGKPVYNFKKVV